MNKNSIMTLEEALKGESLWYKTRVKVETDSLLEYFNEIPQEYIDSLHKGNSKDYVLENLNKHDIVNLQKVLFDRFKAYSFVDGKETISFNIDGDFDKTYLEYILEFYGYELLRKSNVTIEAIKRYSKDATKTIQDNHNIVYVICYKDDLDRIMNHGIRTKCNKYGIAKRIYVVSASPRDAYNVINRICKGRDTDNLIIVKAIANNFEYHYIDYIQKFYTDFPEYENVYFTYNNINIDNITYIWDLKKFLQKHFKDSLYDARKERNKKIKELRRSGELFRGFWSY